MILLFLLGNAVLFVKEAAHAKRSNLVVHILMYLTTSLFVGAFTATTTWQNVDRSEGLWSRQGPYIADRNKNKATFTSLLAEKQVVIVGGGIGGLAVAARLAKVANVTILEQRPSVGGRCGSWIDAAGFRHERGPSLLLLPHIYEELFQEVASCTAKDFGLDYKRCVPAYRAIFDDGDFIDVGYPLDHPEYKVMLSKLDSFEQEGASRWKRYMEACEAYLDCGLPNFIQETFDLKSFPNFLFQALRDFGKAWPLKSHSNVLDGFFVSSKMKALASFQDLYVGLEPYHNKNEFGGGILKSTAPAVFGLLSAIELHPSNSKCGVFAPVGGFDAVTNSIEALARSCGVRIMCNTSVSQVNSSGARTANGDFFPADVVIVNADLPYAEASLLDNKKGQEKFDWEDKYRFSSGVVAFHWSIKQKLDMLSTHTVFLASQSDDAIKSWESVRSNVKFEQPFNFYVHCAGKTDPTACPDGCETVMVLVPCQTLARNESLSTVPREESLSAYCDQFDDVVVGQIREAVYKRMQCVAPGLNHLIISETVDTPASYAGNYNLGAGTPFGLSHGMEQLSYARPAQPGNIPNVLFCGASARPGNGVPLVLAGAKLTSKKASAKLSE